jgi:hypothetical protein
MTSPVSSALDASRHAPFCRDAGKRPGFADLTRRIRRGGWRAEKRKSMCGAHPWQDARRLSARHGDVYATSRAALSPEIRCPRSSASSWQGPLVVPGGAPAPPECRLCVSRPAGAAPRPASRRLMRTPLKRTRWMQDRCGFGGGGLFSAFWDLGSALVRRPVDTPLNANGPVLSTAIDPFRTCEAPNSYLQFSPSDPFQSPRGHGAMCYVLAAFTWQVTAPLNNNL